MTEVSLVDIQYNELLSQLQSINDILCVGLGAVVGALVAVIVYSFFKGAVK